MSLDLNQGLQTLKHLPGMAIKPARELVELGGKGLQRLLPDQYIAHPKLPAYTTIPAGELAQARARSQGLTYDQKAIHDKNGNPHEPVNLVMSGTKAEVQQALNRAGWHQAEELSTESGLKTALTLLDKLTGLHKFWHYNFQSAPVSDMYLDGQRYEMAFNKNSMFDQGRDHLRVFATGKTDALGRPVWEVAATRDVGMEVDLKAKKGTHKVDPAIDKERDMVMADLLGTGEVAGWKIAQGVMAPGERAHTDQNYQTDGQLYTLELQHHPTLRERIAGISGVRKLAHHAPEPVRGWLEAADKKLFRLFKSVN